MKTSNIILATLLGSITFIIIAGAVQVRVTGSKLTAHTEQVLEAIDLRDFKYLVIQKSINLTIAPSEKSQLEIRSATGEKRPRVNYRQVGDTLFIDGIEFGPEGRSLVVILKAPLNNLELIKAEEANFALQDFPGATLDVDLNRTSFNLRSTDASTIGRLRISGVNHSSIWSSNLNVDTLTLYLDESSANIPGTIQQLKGSMANNATLSVGDIAQIDFRKDSSSKLYP
ncbi:MAG: hypothetical protein WEB30_02865 [Cyclobacteriaceae bacterium]